VQGNRAGLGRLCLLKLKWGKTVKKRSRNGQEMARLVLRKERRAALFAKHEWPPVQKPSWLPVIQVQNSQTILQKMYGLSVGKPVSLTAQ
jgi:hypothetical protein